MLRMLFTFMLSRRYFFALKITVIRIFALIQKYIIYIHVEHLFLIFNIHMSISSVIFYSCIAYIFQHNIIVFFLATSISSNRNIIVIIINLCFLFGKQKPFTLTRIFFNILHCFDQFYFIFSLRLLFFICKMCCFYNFLLLLLLLLFNFVFTSNIKMI